jgi:PIN domain nuclease of toxin-antitoxin system
MATTNQFLLDTHVWLWMNGEPRRLSSETRELLADPATELYLSAASAWEIAIKAALGKLQLPMPAARYVAERTAANRLRSLPITAGHALTAGALPPHHRDPFDRLLLGQAIVEELPLLTADRQMGAYDAPLRWAD